VACALSVPVLFVFRGGKFEGAGVVVVVAAAASAVDGGRAATKLAASATTFAAEAEAEAEEAAASAEAEDGASAAAAAGAGVGAAVEPAGAGVAAVGVAGLLLMGERERVVDGVDGALSLALEEDNEGRWRAIDPGVAAGRAAPLTDGRGAPGGLLAAAVVPDEARVVLGPALLTPVVFGAGILLLASPALDERGSGLTKLIYLKEPETSARTERGKGLTAATEFKKGLQAPEARETVRSVCDVSCMSRT
jgi:hypothetical protein